MNPEELVETLNERSRELLKSKGLPVSDSMADLLTEAALGGFRLGSDIVTSMIHGALLLELAKMGKAKE